MEELDLKELFVMFWNKKVQIILIVLIFAVIGIIYTAGFTTPKYSASTSLLLAGSGSSGTQTNTITTTDVTLNSKLVSTYSELVKSKNVLGQVISNLNINEDYETLKNNISVTNVKDTEMIKITVTTENAQNAAKIANETAKVFIEKVANDFYNINNVHIVDEAEVNTTPSNINHKKDILIFAFIGLVIAVMYVLIANMLDTTIKTAEEVEKEYKLPVLASIPLYTGDTQKGKGGRR